MSFCYVGTNGFHTKLENKKFTTTSFLCQQNLKFDDFMLLFDRQPNNGTKEHITFAAQLFFLVDQSYH